MTRRQTVLDLAKGTAVLVQRGVFNPLRPDLAVRSLLTVRRYGPFAGVVANGALRNGGRPALIDERGTLTFAQVDGRSNALARAIGELGLGAGDVIGVMCRDHAGLLLTIVAGNKIGARLVLMNTGFAAPQLTDVVEREKVSAIVADQEFLALLSGVRSEIPRIIAWVDDPDAIGDGDVLERMIGTRPQSRVATPANPGGIVLLTSGTTGTPKGAPRDRVNPLQTAQLLDRIPLPVNSTFFLAAPMFHGTGLALASVGLAMGNTVVLQRRFDAETTMRSIEKHRVAVLVLVPTMLQRIVDLGPEEIARYDHSSLRVVFVAGSSLSPDLCTRATEVFGEVLYNLYGSTEVAVATVANPRELATAPGTVGRPPVGCDVALYDDQDRRITTPGVVGRIFVSSGLSFAGYTDGRQKHIIDGRLSSGDVGYFDGDGLWFVAGRDDDMIVSGGENVYPLEVENLLAGHPDVVEAAVIGVTDGSFGKRLRAFVVATQEGDRDAEAIRRYVKANLARYKVPRDVIFVDKLPRNATGKLLRRQLEDPESIPAPVD
ncbi:MAG: fatty-acyl-CoA synthase [Mycobacterium sp.]|jgi:fatty-acyl-CoA synthase|nr:fatty-acyl-CoA synthase [Mycobacterium sp.]